MSKVFDLNRAVIATDTRDEPPRRLADFGCTSGSVEVVFRDVAERLIREIEGADYVLGCVAWLTHEHILRALARTRGVSIVVQKEDFLRPDVGSNNGWAARLRRRYASLPYLLRSDLPGLVSSLSVCLTPDLDAVRCVGAHNSDRAPAFPRAHHKFVVFGKHHERPREQWEDWHDEAQPPFDIELTSVWTGSFNFTANGGHSLENAVIIRDRRIAEAYFNEYAQVVAISEPLDWDSEWVAPEWRIGT